MSRSSFLLGPLPARLLLNNFEPEKSKSTGLFKHFTGGSGGCVVATSPVVVVVVGVVVVVDEVDVVVVVVGGHGVVTEECPAKIRLRLPPLPRVVTSNVTVTVDF